MKKLHMWLLVFLLSAPLAAWAGESKVDQLRVESAFSQTATGQTQGTNDAYVKGQLEVDGAVQLDGAAVITGNASTDVLTVTAGDVQITAGDIDLDNGQLMVDSAQDLSNNISRNFAGAGTAAVLVVNDDNTSSTNIALDVNQDGTGASTGVRVVHDGTNPALSISAGAARTGDVIAIPMANQLADRAIDITGAITSVAGGGVIEVHGTGVIPSTASLLRLDADTAQPGDGDGWIANFDDDTLVVATPSKYAVLIDSASNEALHVATGKALFDEAATFTNGLVATGVVYANGGVDRSTAAALAIGGANANAVTITPPTTITGVLNLDGGLTIQALTATATVTVKHGLLTLNHISTPIVATIAAPTAATYLTIHNLSASGNVAHTVKLTSGTWDGTNNTATFNFTTAAGQTLTVVGVSATRYVIISNVGTVALSST